MPSTENFELARRKMLRADRALIEYLRHSTYNYAQEIQLASSVKSARDDFEVSVASYLPEISARPSASVPLGSAPAEAADARHECRNSTLVGIKPHHPSAKSFQDATHECPE